MAELGRNEEAVNLFMEAIRLIRKLTALNNIGLVAFRQDRLRGDELF